MSTGECTRLQQPGDVELRVAACPEHLALIRTVTRNLAGSADLDLDAIADTTIAVDELCSTLMMRSVAGGALTCLFRLRDHALRVRMWADCGSGEPIARTDFVWQALSVLVDSVTTWTTSCANAVTVHAELVKKQAGPQPVL